MPSGLSINSTNGLITGTIASGAASNGAANPRITVTDGADTISAGFVWNVNPSLSLASIANQTSSEGTPVTLSLSANDGHSGTLWPE